MFEKNKYKEGNEAVVTIFNNLLFNAAKIEAEYK